ncbi:MAG: nucleotide exchange factor GrpE [Patescibacteria group bacterium]
MAKTHTPNKDKKQKNTSQEELENQLKRTLADYQNLERRIEEERKLLSKLSAALLIEKLLPVLDNIENAQKHLSDQGLELVIKQFKETLQSEGVEEINAQGQEFDPRFHEAIDAQAGETDNKVARVVTKGYKIEDKVLRPAKVIVTKKVDNVNQEEQNMEVIENV